MKHLILVRIVESYYRHRWLYLLPIGIMAVVAGIYFQMQDRLYVSQGVIFVQKESFLASLTSVRPQDFSWNTPAQDTANEINDLIQTDAFVRAVIQQTELESKMNQGGDVVNKTILDVRKKIWASSTGKSAVVVSASNTIPRIAQQLATASINNYIDWKINTDYNQSGVAGDFYQNLIKDYKTQVDQARNALEQYLIAHPEPIRGTRSDLEKVEIDRLQAQLDFANKQLSSAMEKEENAQLATSQVQTDITQTYFLIDAPNIPNKLATSRRQLALKASIYVVVGIILSALGVAGGAILDQSMRFPAEVPQKLDLPYLCSVPEIPKKKKWHHRKKIREVEPKPEETDETLVEKIKVISWSANQELEKTEDQPKVVELVQELKSDHE